MRRNLRIYAAVLSAVVLAGILVVAVAWSHGEAAHTSLHTARSAPPSLAVQSATANPTQAWSSADHLAIGAPQYSGTVVTFAARTVRGRNARTGAQTWAYTRTDRTVCTAAQLGGTTIAVFELHGNCDELTALDSSTGVRRWTRTLDKDGQPVNGRPQFQAYSYALLVTTPTAIYDVDPGSGLDRWTYSRFGCRIEGAVVGQAGALISQTCAASAQCPDPKYCASGPQLLLRDPYQGNGDSSKPNPDQIKWLLHRNSSTPVSSGQLITAVDPGGARLDVFDQSTGKVIATTAIAAASAPVRAIDTSGGELIWTGNQLYLAQLGTDVVAWSTPLAVRPTLVALDGSDPPNISDARLTALVAGSVQEFDPHTGKLLAQIAVTPTPSGVLAYPFGTGFLISGAGGTVAYL
jgi:hypothetical protein